MNKKTYAKLAVVAAVVYVSFCALVYFEPQLFFYNPSPEHAKLEATKLYPATEVTYTSSDGAKLYAWYTKPAQKRNKMIVFLHGNSYNIENFYHKLEPFVAAGYGTFLPEYRGFGGIKGQINQENLQKDTKAAIDELHRLGFKNSDIILYGMSLGSYTATYAAAELGKQKPFSALVLEVPFDSMINVVKARVWLPLPLEFILQDKFENQERIAKLNIPVLVMGAGQDKVVPMRLAQELFDLAGAHKDLIIYETASHNNLFDFKNYEDILVWLKDNEKTR